MLEVEEKGEASYTLVASLSSGRRIPVYTSHETWICYLNVRECHCPNAPWGSGKLLEVDGTSTEYASLDLKLREPPSLAHPGIYTPGNAILLALKYIQLIGRSWTQAQSSRPVLLWSEWASFLALSTVNLTLSFWCWTEPRASYALGKHAAIEKHSQTCNSWELQVRGDRNKFVQDYTDTCAANSSSSNSCDHQIW